MICFNCLSLLYTSLATLKQYDIKRIVAYSSIGHMNICMIGLFTFDIVGSIGSVLLMLGHGFVSSGLFLLIGMLYNRYKTKLITYYSGLVYTMPLWSSFFFLYSIFNISFPGTSNFVGEFLIIYSIVEYGNYCIVAVMLIALFACAAYTIWLTNRILFGMPRIPNTVHCFDMDILEFSILMPITMMVFIVGIFPTIFSELVLLDVSRITNQCL